MSADNNTKNKLLIAISDEMLEEIDDYRFANKYNNRTEAIRAIIQLGLEAGKQNNQNEKN